MYCAYKNHTLAVVALAAVFLISMASSSSAFRVHGRVINGTTGLPVSSATIEVINPSGGMLTEKEIQTIDDQGRFEVDGLKEDTPAYLLRVTYQDVNYTDIVRYHGHDAIEIEIKVYESTNSWQDVQVSVPHVMVSRSQDTLRVDKFYQITNNSSPPKTIYGRNARFLLYMPDDLIAINSVHVQSLGIPLPVTPIATDEPGFRAIDHPIKPGVTQVTASFDLPYEGSVYNYNEPMKYDLGEMTIITRDPSLIVTSSTAAVGGPQDFRGFKAYTLSGLTAEKPLALTFSGGGRSMGGTPQVFIIPNPTHNLSIAIMVVVVLILGLVLFLVASRQPSKETRRELLQGQKEEFLNQLAKLDDLYKAETISDQLYRIKRAELVNALAHIYYEISYNERVNSEEVKNGERAARV